MREVTQAPIHPRRLLEDVQKKAKWAFLKCELDPEAYPQSTEVALVPKEQNISLHRPVVRWGGFKSSCI